MQWYIESMQLQPFQFSHCTGTLCYTGKIKRKPSWRMLVDRYLKGICSSNSYVFTVEVLALRNHLSRWMSCI